MKTKDYNFEDIQRTKAHKLSNVHVLESQEDKTLRRDYILKLTKKNHMFTQVFKIKDFKENT